MTNDLKNFLEKYHDNEIFSDDQLGEIQYVIIPKVLDLVEKEVEKYSTEMQGGNPLPTEGESTAKDISTIINNLRV